LASPNRSRVPGSYHHRFDGRHNDHLHRHRLHDDAADALEAELFAAPCSISRRRPQWLRPLSTSSALYRAARGTLFIKNIGEMPRAFELDSCDSSNIAACTSIGAAISSLTFG